MSNKILRHGHTSDTAANWKNNNPILGVGEFGIETDTNKLKIGNGVDHWNALIYVSDASKINNIQDSTSTGGINQIFDTDSTFNFTGKNVNATELDSTLTGNITKGSTGNYASSFGGKSAAMGKRSHAEGTTTIAKGNYSHAEGDNSVTLGDDSHAEGYSTVTKGNQSHAEGISTITIGMGSHAEGYGSKTNAPYSHVEGEYTITNAEASHAEGFYTEASGLYSHVEGNKSKVLNTLPTSSDEDSGGSSESSGTDSGSGSTVPASFNMDEHLGESSHAEGAENEALGYASHAEGGMNKAYGHLSHVEGEGNITGSKTSLAKGNCAHAEGYCTTSSSTCSHTEGYQTTATGTQSIGAHAEGYQTRSLEKGAHAEGDGSIAEGHASHAEGNRTTASGDSAHTEGISTSAKGVGSHAEGESTVAEGHASHAGGYGTYAYGEFSHVEGKYNIKDINNKYAHIVGNGTSSSRSNAHTLDWSGNSWYQGTVKVGGTSYDDANAKELATKKYVDDSVSSAGGGDMLKSVYDKDNDGVIDDIALLQYYGTTNITISDESYFTVNATGETITGLTDTGKTQTELVIPYKINGIIITTLDPMNTARPILYGAEDNITKVVLPNSITSIKGNAFIGCVALTSINIPDSVSSIATYAFYACSSLTSINISNNIKIIDDSVFANCSSLKSIDIPNSVTTIAPMAFDGCTSLTSVSIPNSVTYIDDNAFGNITASQLTIYCEQGSYAETKAKINGIPVMYTDISAATINAKADKSTTLSGYGIEDAYTKTEVNNKIPSYYDIIIDDTTDLSQYSDQTISGKKIFFKKGQVSSSVINITFSSCVIYGNNKSFGTRGTVSYKYCIIYNLNSSPHYDDAMDPVSGQSIFEDCKIYGGSMSEYYDPSVTRCRVHGCSFSAYGMSVGTKDSIYDQCDFGNCYPLAMTGNTYNIFTNCYNMSGDYTPLTGECYFSGCRGSVRVSSSATIKPSTTTAFVDQNFATLTIS